MDSTSVLVHLVGIFAVSQLIGNTYQPGFYENLNTNATGVLNNAFKIVTDVVDLLPEWIRLGTLLQWILYASVALYLFYLAGKVYTPLLGNIQLHRSLGDIGYDYQKGVSRKDLMNEVRRRRKVGNLPPVFPNGWFFLMRSDNLPIKGTRSMNVMGQHFAIFRDEEGTVHVIDAYCAHLGANLAVGGKVTGKCIECPFHGWTYSGETGQCTKIPYSSGKIPSTAKVKVWPSLENNGCILVWYDAEERDPSWFPEEFEQIKSGRWVYRGCSSHVVNAHAQEISENGADLNHLNFLHSPGVSGTGIDSHEWLAKWEKLPPPNGHIGCLKLQVANKFFGFHFKPLNVQVTGHQVGPGIVYLMFKTLIGSGLMLLTITPQEPLLQKFNNYIYTDWWIPTFVTRIILGSEVCQFERDLVIFNNKSYALKPVLPKEDQFIAKHRRWYSQFYSENSPKLSFRKEDLSF